MGSPTNEAPKEHRFELRLTGEDLALLQANADTAALTNSEYLRRLIRKHRVANRGEERLWNELRRLGGLQKHLATECPDRRAEFNRVLQEIILTLKTVRNRGQEAEQ